MPLPRRPRNPKAEKGKLSRRAKAFGRVLGERARRREEEENRRRFPSGPFA